jgi:hypothetical protein
VLKKLRIYALNILIANFQNAVLADTVPVHVQMRAQKGSLCMFTRNFTEADWSIPMHKGSNTFNLLSRVPLVIYVSAK